MRDEPGAARAPGKTGPPPLATVRPDWVDHYGHMNMAFYLAVFDMATDQLWPRLGLGPGFRARGLGTFAAETKTRVRERGSIRRRACADASSRALATEEERLGLGSGMPPAPGREG